MGHRDILGLPLLEALPEVAGQGFFEILSRVRDTGEPFFVDERPFMLQPEPGGPPEERFVALAYHPGHAPDGAISGVLAHGVDVTDQVRSREAIARMNEALEAAVADRTAQLQAAVKEAEGFNYSIAHDLRAPLRAIVSTSVILMEDLGPELDLEHRRLLERQPENARRLGRLIDELLRLSRFSRAEVARQALDMTAESLSVFADLQDSGRTNGCLPEVQEGMEAEGDAGLVRTVLHNLIGNACKFSPNGGAVSVRQEGNVFSLCDEGVGFDMDYAPRLFLPFERLVSETEYEGTGIGLANVERIVRRHGGDVWAESEAGKGATFYFTLAPGEGHKGEPSGSSQF